MDRASLLSPEYLESSLRVIEILTDLWITCALITRHDIWHASWKQKLRLRYTTVAIIQLNRLAFRCRLMLLTHLKGQNVLGLLSFACIRPLLQSHLPLRVSGASFLMAPPVHLILFYHLLLGI